MTRTSARHKDDEFLAEIEADVDEPIGPPIHGVHLRDIARAGEQRNQAEAAVRAAVAKGRDAGLSWATIGAALGVSKQAVAKRYGV